MGGDELRRQETHAQEPLQVLLEEHLDRLLDRVARPGQLLGGPRADAEKLDVAHTRIRDLGMSGRLGA